MTSSSALFHEAPGFVSPVRAPAAARSVLTPHGFRPRAAFAASSLFSVSLHAAAALAVITWGHNEFGAVEQRTEAITIELMASSVVEQAAVDVREVSSGATASVAQEVGAAFESITPRSVAEAEPEPLDAEAPSAEVEARQPTPTEILIAGTAESEDALPPPPASKTETRATEKHAQRRPETKRQTEKSQEQPVQQTKPGAKASKKGGAPSRASTPSAAGAGRASASTGDILGYAARVRARVAGNRPGGRGQRGTAVVSFGVSRSGGLTYVRLSRSSGAAALDQAALSAVRRSAPFPPPPAGAPASRLAFSVPFHFR